MQGGSPKKKKEAKEGEGWECPLNWCVEETVECWDYEDKRENYHPLSASAIRKQTSDKTSDGPAKIGNEGGC